MSQCRVNWTGTETGRNASINVDELNPGSILNPGIFTDYIWPPNSTHHIFWLYASQDKPEGDDDDPRDGFHSLDPIDADAPTEMTLDLVDADSSRVDRNIMRTSYQALKSCFRRHLV